MPNLNRSQLEGHLGKDPQVKKIKDTDFASFSIATNETIKDKKETDWHFIECWGIWARLAATLKTGDAVHIEGKSKSRTYEKDGKKQTFNYIRVDSFHKILHIDLKESQPEEQAEPNPDPKEDDLPF